MSTDPLIGRLHDERDALVERVAAIDQAIEALTGTRPANGATITRRAGSVGEDKLAMVRDYIRAEGTVRQAEIARELNLNSGTVSTATQALAISGEIEELPKQNRSKVWRAIG
jgi:ribosomal protein S25